MYMESQLRHLKLERTYLHSVLLHTNATNKITLKLAKVLKKDKVPTRAQ